jgi:hypothetical protein
MGEGPTNIPLKNFFKKNTTTNIQDVFTSHPFFTSRFNKINIFISIGESKYFLGI